MGPSEAAGVGEVVFRARQEAYLHAYRRYERALRNFERIRAIHRDPDDLSEYRSAEERIISAEDALDEASAKLEIGP